MTEAIIYQTIKSEIYINVDMYLGKTGADGTLKILGDVHIDGDLYVRGSNTAGNRSNRSVSMASMDRMLNTLVVNSLESSVWNTIMICTKELRIYI